MVKNHWKGCFRQSKLQNFLCLPTMVTDRIFRHIPTDCLEFEMTAEKWNYLITMTAKIQNVISSTGHWKLHIYIDKNHGKWKAQQMKYLKGINFLQELDFTNFASFGWFCKNWFLLKLLVKCQFAQVKKLNFWIMQIVMLGTKQWRCWFTKIVWTDIDLFYI